MRQSQEGRALRQFTLSTGKSAGRNSSGRITVFHRGGGSKRLQRRIDLKRSTSSMGIVERIEYDPNRSSRIAPVRWIEGVPLGRFYLYDSFVFSLKIFFVALTYFQYMLGVVQFAHFVFSDSWFTTMMMTESGMAGQPIPASGDHGRPFIDLNEPPIDLNEPPIDLNREGTNEQPLIDLNLPPSFT